jgi:HAD superfamily hydrolase (TIGR01484 family)
MRPLADFPAAAADDISYVLTDIDGTLTREGRLPAATYGALERLQEAGLKVIPVTAGSSGWCDLIARMWPVDAVISENGGIYFYRVPTGAIERRYWANAAERREHKKRLRAVLGKAVRLVPGIAPSPDQDYREATFALTTIEGMLPSQEERVRLQALLREEKLHTTINSMWVLGWIGDFDKLAMTRRLMSENFGINIEREQHRILYVGDSLNDEPMFGFFPHSVGVATVMRELDQMASPPQWITKGAGGDGFVEVADMLLQCTER